MVVKKNATKEKRKKPFGSFRKELFFVIEEEKNKPFVSFPKRKPSLRREKERVGEFYFPKSHFPNNLLVCAIWLISRQSATIGIATPTEQRMSSRKLG